MPLPWQHIGQLGEYYFRDMTYRLFMEMCTRQTRILKALHDNPFQAYHVNYELSFQISRSCLLTFCTMFDSSTQNCSPLIQCA